jgi:hypothetical protein
LAIGIGITILSIGSIGITILSIGSIGITILSIGSAISSGITILSIGIAIPQARVMGVGVFQSREHVRVFADLLFHTRV